MLVLLAEASVFPFFHDSITFSLDTNQSDLLAKPTPSSTPYRTSSEKTCVLLLNQRYNELKASTLATLISEPA